MRNENDWVENILMCTTEYSNKQGAALGLQYLVWDASI